MGLESFFLFNLENFRKLSFLMKKKKFRNQNFQMSLKMLGSLFKKTQSIDFTPKLYINIGSNHWGRGGGLYLL